MSMSVETRQSILVLVELCYDMAEDDFGGEPRADHFFIDVLRVAEWLETQGLRTPKRAIPGPSIPPPCLETPPPCQAKEDSQVERLKALPTQAEGNKSEATPGGNLCRLRDLLQALRAEAEAVMSDTSIDDCLLLTMREVADSCTSVINFLPRCST